MVIDNYLPLDKFKALQDTCLSTNFPWYWQSHVSLPPWCYVDDPLAMETFGWNHQIYDKETNFQGLYLEAFETLLTQIKQTLNMNCMFIRIRLSMKVFKKNFTEENYNLPHIDYNFPHKTIIYYLNDSDGPTWIFNEKFDGIYEPKKFTVKEKILPKENRILFLDGFQYHTASNPIDTDRRVIININYITK
jgi:hypothetical protein